MRLRNGGGFENVFCFSVYKMNCKRKRKKIFPNNHHPIFRFFAVFNPVVLQIGQRFFCFSHSFMHWLWKSCPHSSVPMSSPSVYSSCDKFHHSYSNRKSLIFLNKTLLLIYFLPDKYSTALHLVEILCYF